MKFYLETANVAEIERMSNLGLVDGVIMDSFNLAKEGKNLKEILPEISLLNEGAVHVELTSLTAESLVEEARELAKWSDNIVVKIPMSEAALKAVYQLAQENIQTHVTLIFNLGQGLLAAKAGANYISPFMGSLDDSRNSFDLCINLKKVFTDFDLATEVISSNLRCSSQLEKVVENGIESMTIPINLLIDLWSYPVNSKYKM